MKLLPFLNGQLRNRNRAGAPSPGDIGITDAAVRVYETANAGLDVELHPT